MSGHIDWVGVLDFASYELLPRVAAEKVRERDASLIVLDHGQDQSNEPSTATSEDDAYYARFKVPDDLVW